MATDGSDKINPFKDLGVATSAPKTSQPNDRLGQEQFLELMVAQLKNQDPLKPMQNGEFLGQMAQFGTVSGIQDLQNSINQLASSLQSNQALQASALVGRAVLTESSQGHLSDTEGLRGVADLPTDTTDLKITITDLSGQLVRDLEMGPQSAGPVQFTWDGIRNDGQAAAEGTYIVTAEGLLDGQAAAIDTRVAAAVESVSLGGPGEGIVLNLAGIGAVPLAQVTEIL